MASVLERMAERDTCDVCALVDDDPSQKDVHYCERCGANMCAPCSKSPVRRARALFLRAARGLPRREAV